MYISSLLFAYEIWWSVWTWKLWCTGLVLRGCKLKRKHEVWKNIQDHFQKELQIVFSIAFSICGRINCDIIQTQLQILHNCFHVRERTVTENTNGNARFAIAFGLCHNLCVHIWKRIQFAIPFENGPEYSSIMKSTFSWSCNKLAKQIWQMLQCIFLFLFTMSLCSFEQCNQSQTVDFLNTVANQRCLIWSESTHSWKRDWNNHSNGQGEKHVKMHVH